ncbi:HAMP domain-containing protein, partial [Pseudomonas asplenii]|uniref:HAMP domain-containing protein n=1 Tax=Pseudomonas asplenii TaxID=53407 RepID=UPI0003784286
MNIALRILALTATALFALLALALASNQAVALIIPIAIVAAVVIALQGWQLQHSLANQLGGDLQALVELGQQLVRGETSPTPPAPAVAGSLRGTLQQLSVQIEGLAQNLQHVLEEHARGDIDVALNTRLPGLYGEMAQGINTLVASHIDVKKKAMACVFAIAQGNLGAPLEAFPGKKAFINENVETLRGNLTSLLSEMRRMSDEHDKGDIDVVIDASRFQGSYGEIAQGINDMVAGHISVKKKAMACIKAFSEGDLTAPLERFPGKKAFINDSIETLRRNIQALIEDTQMLSQAALDGRLDTRADASRHEGDFRRIVNGINDTLEAIVTPLREAMNVIEGMASGDLTRTMDGRYNGHLDELQQSLNATVSKLADVIGQVHQSTSMLSSAAEEISATAQSLSEAASSQAASVEETSASMEQMSASIAQNT